MALNSTSFPVLSSDAWSGYVQQAQAHLPSQSRLLLLGLVNLPVVIVILNALRQVVSMVIFERMRRSIEHCIGLGITKRPIITA